MYAHSLRHRFGPVHFYALMGGLAAIMSWLTDASVTVQVAGTVFVVGSTVFYTALLLGVFVVYVFDGPRATRIAISTVAGVSAMLLIVAAVLHFQTGLIGTAGIDDVPLPSLRRKTILRSQTIRPGKMNPQAEPEHAQRTAEPVERSSMPKVEILTVKTTLTLVHSQP